MKKFKFSTKMILIIVLVFIVSLVDFLILSGSIFPHFIVSSNYSEIIFGSLCTIASIGSALISLVVGTLDKRFYGFTIKEIVKKMSSMIEINTFICLDFFSIVAGLLLMTIDFVNTLTVLFLYIITLTCYISCVIWKLICDEDFLLKCVKKFCLNDAKEENIIRLLNDLYDVIDLGNETKKNEYLNIIYEQLLTTINQESSSNVRNKNSEIERLIKSNFERNCSSVGFVQAYKEILKFNDWNHEDFFDSDKIAIDYIEKIEYCSESEIEKFNIPNTINDIIEYMNIDDFEKIRFALKYLLCVCDNDIINERFFIEKLKSIFEKICRIGIDVKSGYKHKIIVLFLKYEILTNEDLEKAKQIFSLLVNALINQNLYSKNKYFIATISDIFRAIYFYSFWEKEMLKPKHREKLVELFNVRYEKCIDIDITLSMLIFSKRQPVVRWLCEDVLLSDKYEQSKIFEYYGNSYAAKTMVWTRDNILLFAFAMYVMFGERENRLFPADKILNNNNCDDKTSRNIYSLILSFFDDNLNLRAQVLNIIKNLETIFNKRKFLSENLIKDNYEYYNDLLTQLKIKNDSEIKPKEDVDICNLIKYVNKELNNVNEFTFNNNVSLDKCSRDIIKYSVRRKSEKNVEEAGYEFAYDIMNYVGWLISNNLRKVKINFEQNGIHTLLSELQSENYHLCSYKYIDDFAIKQSCRDTEEFKELEKKINDIHYIESGYFNDYFYLKEDKIEYNYQISDYVLTELTDEECNQYINKCQISDGRYNIDGQILDYNKALNLLKDLYQSERISFKLAVNTTAESGFKVDIDFDK